MFSHIIHHYAIESVEVNEDILIRDSKNVKMGEREGKWVSEQELKDGSLGLTTGVKKILCHVRKDFFKKGRKK